MSDTYYDEAGVGYSASSNPFRARVPTTGMNRAEENRFRTLSDINRRDSTVPRQSLFGMDLGPGVPATPGAIDAVIRAKYPFMAAFLGHAEVGPLLREAALKGWGEAELYGALQGTNWWRSTSGAARTWDNLASQDPAEAARLANQTVATVQNRARSLGINMSAGQLEQVALTATRNGWTDNQVVDELLRSLNWSTVQAGDLTALVDQVKSIAGSYLVSVSDATAQSYAAAIASGEMSETGVASVMQRQAKARFPWMESQIDQGVTPANALMPVRDTIAQELEMAPEMVDLMNPQWLGMIEVAGEDGQLRAATREEARLAARKDPRWAGTGGAQEMATKAAAAIRDVFGRRPI